MLAVTSTQGREGVSNTHVGLPLWRFSSHEGMRQAVARAALPVTGLIIALELAGAPAGVQGAVAAALLTQLHVIVDHLIWLCMNKWTEYIKM